MAKVAISPTRASNTRKGCGFGCFAFGKREGNTRASVQLPQQRVQQFVYRMQGWSPAHLAVSQSNLEILEILLDACIDRLDSTYLSSLFTYASHGRGHEAEQFVLYKYGKFFSRHFFIDQIREALRSFDARPMDSKRLCRLLDSCPFEFDAEECATLVLAWGRQCVNITQGSTHFEQARACFILMYFHGIFPTRSPFLQNLANFIPSPDKEAAHRLALTLSRPDYRLIILLMGCHDINSQWSRLLPTEIRRSIIIRANFFPLQLQTGNENSSPDI